MAELNPDKQAENRDWQGRFPPGVSGNPQGRPPKRLCITDSLRELIGGKPNKT